MLKNESTNVKKKRLKWSTVKRKQKTNKSENWGKRTILKTGNGFRCCPPSGAPLANFVKKNKDYKIGICCLSAKHTALRGKRKDWLVRNQNNVSEWGDMSIRGLLFQWAISINIQLSVLV